MSILLTNHRLPFINRIVYTYHIANFSSSNIFAVWVRNGREYNEISGQVICRWFACLHLGSQYTCTYLPPSWFGYICTHLPSSLFWVHLHLPPSILVLSTPALTSLHLGSEYTCTYLPPSWFSVHLHLPPSILVLSTPALTSLHLGSQYICTYLPPSWFSVHLHLPPSILVLSTPALTSLHLGSEYIYTYLPPSWFSVHLHLPPSILVLSTSTLTSLHLGSQYICTYLPPSWFSVDLHLPPSILVLSTPALTSLHLGSEYIYTYLPPSWFWGHPVRCLWTLVCVLYATRPPSPAERSRPCKNRQKRLKDQDLTPFSERLSRGHFAVNLCGKCHAMKENTLFRESYNEITLVSVFIS